MNIFVEIEKLEGEVRNLEFRQSSFKDGILGIDREITLLKIKELALQENIKNLKKNNVIVLVAEFKRSKEDLNRTKNRLDMILKDKQNLEDALVKVVNLLVKNKSTLVDLKEQQGNNVLTGNFGNKNVK